MNPTIEADLIQALDIPAEQRFVSIKATEAEFLRRFVEDKQCTRTLEVGFAYGFSAAHIMASTTGTHTVMDPNQTQVYGRAGVQNLEKVGFDDRLDLREACSWEVLPKLHQEGRTFDFAFVDGDHRFDGVFQDFFQVDKILDEGGYVLFHDTWMRGIQLTANFIRTNRADYTERPSPEPNILVFEKTGEDTRDWHHFREFYTLRSLVRHPLVRAVVHGPDSALKRIATRLRKWKNRNRGH